MTGGLDPQWRETLDRDGWVLLRDAGMREPADLARVRRELGGVAAPQGERFAPRHDLGDGVGGETRWPPDRTLCPNHEGSFAVRPPELMLYACLRPAERGGAMLLCDAARVLAALPPALVGRVRADGWVLTRTFHRYVGMAWTDALGVPDAGALGRWCEREKVAHRWSPDGGLRTTRRRPGTARHPRTGRELWFNGLGFFNRLTLLERERAVLAAAFGLDALPMDTYLGDGSPLTQEDYDAIEAAYAACQTTVTLGAGDLLIVDNLRTAAGRMPYEGDREVLTAAVNIERQLLTPVM